MRVRCEVYADRVRGDYAPLVDGVIAVCSRCEARSEAIGEGPWSIKAALAKLRAECPNKETNFYVDEEDDHVDTTHHVVGKINIWGKP
jgi:hypothetical protein